MEFHDQKCCVCGTSERAIVAMGKDWQYGTSGNEFAWARCASCGHHYLTAIPAANEVGQLYPPSLKNYEDFDRNPGLAFRVKSFLDGRALRELTRGIAPGAAILDVGCASGMFLDAVRAYCPQFTVLEGLEISRDGGRIAERKGYRVHYGLIEDAAFDRLYDAIVLQQVIEHVHDPNRTLTRLFELLKPGGLLVMETPWLDCLDRRIFKGWWEGWHIPRHFNLWTGEGMRATLERHGFRQIRIEKKIKPVHWILSLQNLALDKQLGSRLVRFFDLRNPLLLTLFGLIDVLQLTLLGKASDVRYVAVRPAEG